MIERLEAESTDCFRLFHGTAEGLPGFALDRYGPMALLQCFREPLDAQLYPAIEALARRAGAQFLVVWLRRRGQSPELRFGPATEVVVREDGVGFQIATHHPGHDPHLFLDLRATRRWVRRNAAGKRVLNLFAYTCGVGLQAEAGGAERVVNVDFSASALARGRDNAALNGCSRQDYWQEEVLPVLWQLAGRKLPQRGPALAIQPEPFDLVVIDPPQRSRGRFGSTDLGSDYQSLFRPALKLLAPGGTIVAVNNLASLPLEEFQKQLERCARKAGCAIVMETLSPDEDFPSFDGRPPLKVILAVPDGAIGSVRRDLR